MNALIQYKSSAGSGKTFTLVFEYLKIVIREPWEYRAILAITFTNKATEEMKARIINSLSDLAYGTAEELEKLAIHDMLKAYFEAEQIKIDIPSRARMVLNFILSDYSNFSVSTIESFFQRVIRAFSKELNLPLGYEVDMEQQSVLERIIQQTFQEIGTNKDLTNILRTLTERNMEEDKGWQIDKRIKDLGQEIFKEQFQEQLVQFNEENEHIQLEEVKSLEQKLYAIRKQFEKQMEKWAQEAVEIMQRFGLVREDFKGKGRSVPGYFKKVLDKKEYEPTKTARKAVEDDKQWYTAKSEHKDKILAALAEGLQGLMEQMVDYYDQHITDYNSARLAAQNLYSFGVMNDLQRKLIDYRLEHNRLIISDTNYLLRQIVSEQDTPFIYEKVGTRFRYYLIDEFQDTSDMQWENLRPLVLEALSTGKGSLIVGDVKQSIYRWRNGNMELLLYKVQKEMEDRHQNVTTKPLQNNWRTAHQVVDFNNHFFEKAVELLLENFATNENAQTVIASAYAEIAQIPKIKKIDGLVRLEHIPNEKGGDPWKRLAEQRCLEIIRNLKQEAFSLADICLLVRTNSEAVAISEFLQEAGIRVASAESLKLNNHPQVRFLHALLLLLNHEEESLYRAQVSFYYHLLKKQQSNQQQVSIAFEPGEAFTHEVFADQQGTTLPSELRGKMALLRQQPVYECLERLIQLFPQLLSHNAYVQAFLDQALAYGAKNEASIGGFLEFWAEFRTKPAIPADAGGDAVEVMTIHKAKGLEFPVVILPYASWDMEPKSGSLIWVRPDRSPYDQFAFLPLNFSSKLEHSHFKDAYDRERLLSYLDNLNLLYVAFTRPEYRLYLLCPTRSKHSLKQADGLIQETIDQLALESSLIQHGESNWTYGKATERQSKTSSTASQYLKGPDKLLASWNQAVRVRYSSNRYLKGGILERSDKIKMGELLHEALAHVIVPADVPRAARAMVHKGYLPGSLQEAFERMLREVIGFEGIAEYFEPHWKVKAEAEVLTDSGKVLRPDRVNFVDNKAVVIDYKTGHKKEVYTKQVKVYMDALASLGFSEIKGIIYYTSLEVVEEIF